MSSSSSRMRSDIHVPFSINDARGDVPPEIWLDILERVAATNSESFIRFICSCKYFYSMSGIRTLKSRISLSPIYNQIPGLSRSRVQSIFELTVLGNEDAMMVLGTYIGLYKNNPPVGLYFLNMAANYNHPQAIYNANIMHRLCNLVNRPVVDMSSFCNGGSHSDLLAEYRFNLRLMLNSAVLVEIRAHPQLRCFNVGPGHNIYLLQENLFLETETTCPVCLLDKETWCIRLAGLAG